MAPRTLPTAEDAAREAVRRLATPCDNGWFRAEPSAAFAIFQAVLPDDSFGNEWPEDASTDHDGSPNPAARATESCGTETGALGDARVIADDSLDNDAARVPTHTRDVTGKGEVDPILWDYVESCVSCEATKSTDIRALLISRLGKPRATQLLAKTRATVAKDAQGRQNRVLRANGALLKLKSACK